MKKDHEAEKKRIVGRANDPENPCFACLKCLGELGEEIKRQREK